MESLKNKIALITGSGGAVGSFVTRSLLNAGCKTALVYRSDKHAETLSKLREEYGDQVLIIQADLATESDAGNTVDRCLSEFGQVDFLVNPVGGWLGGKRVHEHSFDDLEKMLNIDLKPTFNILQAVLPAMVNGGRGKIINFVSMAIFDQQKNNAIYAASKSAVASLTKAVAQEYGAENIQAFALAPSTINSEANRQAMPDADHSTWVDLDEITQAIVYLCASGDSLSGTTLKFTGTLH